MSDRYEIINSFTGESYGFCNEVERYTTPLAKIYPLIFKPTMKNNVIDNFNHNRESQQEYFGKK
jgi:hypothetical protein